VERRHRIAAPYAGVRQHPDGSVRLGRRQLHRLRQSAHGRTDRPFRARARPEEAQGTVGGDAGDLRPRAAGVAAVLPRRPARGAEMAARLCADRPRRSQRPVVGELAGGVGTGAVAVSLTYVSLNLILTHMVKTQVYLRKEELEALQAAAARSGRSVAA